MPPLPPIANVLRLILKYDNSPTAPPNPSHAINQLYLQYSGPISFTATECVAVANGAMVWWTSHFQPLLSTSWQLNGAEAHAADGTGVFGVSTSAAVLGTTASAPLPPQCAVCLSWVGAPGYRGGKPRSYLPGIPTSAIVASSSSLNGTYALSVKTAGTAAIADMSHFTVGGATPVIGTVSYISKTLTPSPPHHRATPLFWQYLACNVHERLDSQRRRSGKERSFISV
jgi:hypothetical protein